MGNAVEKVNIICLHGFLGKSSDWDLIHSYFVVSPLASRIEWWSVDYMNQPELNSTKSFLSWTEAFNRKVLKKFPDGRRVLVGYSLGGRLALHALAAKSNIYDAAIFLSTNPGILREREKQERLQADQQWAQKFAALPWPELLGEWNAQSVFKGGALEPQREEGFYDRTLLSSALVEWSLAKQEDFRERITKNSEKILWLSGEKDIKFLSLAMELKKRAPGLSAEVVAKSSHRLIFDNPSEVAQLMIQFLQDRV